MSAVIELNQIRQHYGRLQVLHDVSWSLQAGEIMGLFGHNGAGKTTTVRLILGLIRPTSGQLKVLGGPAWKPCSTLPVLRVRRSARSVSCWNRWA